MKKLLLNVCVVLVIFTLGLSGVSAQNVFTMCSGPTTTSDTSGILYDSGGPNDIYQINEDCSLLIAPSCATSITLTFQNFRSEGGWDFFHVYDGMTDQDPEVLVADDTIVPGPVTCTSGYMLIVWHSDFTIVDSGFVCSWTSVIAPSVAPTAAFGIGNINPPLNVNVQFTDQSTGGPTSWIWEFGDGDTAHSQNPMHAYSAPGNYTVRLISFTCNESDTITHTLTVQGPPNINVTPLTGFSATVQCGDSMNFTMNVGNTGGGELVFNTSGSSVGKIRVLAMTYGTNQFAEYPRTIAAIHQHFNNDTITSTGTIDPGVLNGLLVGKNVLLIPEQSYSTDPMIWTNFGPVIRQFLNNGGSVVFLGSASSFSNDLFDTDVFNGSFAEDETGFSLQVNSTAHPLMNGITSSTITAPGQTFSMSLTDPDKVTLVEYLGNDVVSYRYYGSGKAIFIGFDYFASNNETSRILANAIEWGGENALPNWIHINPAGDTVSGGGTRPVTVTFVASSLPAGTYYANIGVGSNDPNEPLVIVPCTLSVNGFPIIGLSQACVNIGQVMQHTTVRDTFRVLNTGCDTLKVSSMVSTNSDFTLSPNFNYLLPGAYADVIVTFNGTTVGNFTGNVNINNNDVDTTVCLTATTFPAPAVSTSASTISENIRACGATGTTSFSITNTGGSDLQFQLGSLPSWLSAVPTSDTLAAGASVTITLQYTSATFPASSQQSSILIVSNDPLVPNKNIGFTMVVDSNPCVDYNFTSNTCTGFSTFTTSTINTPTSYVWAFGDGDSSFVANPTHSYPSNGTFTATLIACNNSGCDTVVQTINAIITGPRATQCYPNTITFCNCGIGITDFKITGPGPDRINKVSNDAIDGYQDYTCTDTATLAILFPYGIEFTTGATYIEIVKAWLDMNNDGVFDSINELLYIDTALVNHTGTLWIPSLPTNVYGEPLRLRIASDYSGNPTPQPCSDLQFGQVEDYSVFLSIYDGVNELSKETNFNVYPNPFDNTASIDYSLKNSSKVSVEVYNILGDKVNVLVNSEIQSAGKYSYNFSGQSSGVYFVKLTVDGSSLTSKVVKM